MARKRQDTGQQLELDFSRRPSDQPSRPAGEKHRLHCGAGPSRLVRVVDGVEVPMTAPPPEPDRQASRPPARRPIPAPPVNYLGPPNRYRQ